MWIWITIGGLVLACIAAGIGFIACALLMLEGLERNRKVTIGSTAYRLVPITGDEIFGYGLSPSEQALRDALRDGKLDAEIERATRRNAERRGA